MRPPSDVSRAWAIRAYRFRRRLGGSALHGLSQVLCQRVCAHRRHSACGTRKQWGMILGRCEISLAPAVVTGNASGRRAPSRHSVHSMHKLGAMGMTIALVGAVACNRETFDGPRI